MGPDSSPKKWSLKEQRAAYLQWFALADEGLLPRRLILFHLADEWMLLNFILIAPVLLRERIKDGDGRLTGNDELRFFAMSNLSKPELKQVN